MLVPFWTIRVILIILLWPVAYLVRMTAVTLACVMILMRPFIPFFYVASFVAFCALWSKSNYPGGWAARLARGGAFGTCPALARRAGG